MTMLAAIADGTARCRILLVEDNAVNRTIATKLLEKRGHVVIAVENGALAVDATASEHFDVVLMDVQMPVMDGLTATTHIRDPRARRPAATCRSSPSPPTRSIRIASAASPPAWTTTCRSRSAPPTSSRPSPASRHRRRCSGRRHVKRAEAACAAPARSVQLGAVASATASRVTDR